MLVKLTVGNVNVGNVNVGNICVVNVGTMSVQGAGAELLQASVCRQLNIEATTADTQK